MIALSPYDFDVVVIGAGLAGHCAASSAVESGAQELLVEKDNQTEGSIHDRQLPGKSSALRTDRRSYAARRAKMSKQPTESERSWHFGVH